MTTKSERWLTIFWPLYVAADGVHYFLAGKDLANSTVRNAAVVVQIIGGMAIAFWLWWKGRTPPGKKG